jgi:hypothetical protein
MSAAEVATLAGVTSLAAAISVPLREARGETLHFSEKLFPLITSKRDECRSGVFQPITVRDQRHECAGLTVAVCPDNYKGGFSEALSLSQVLLRPDR